MQSQMQQMQEKAITALDKVFDSRVVLEGGGVVILGNLGAGVIDRLVQDFLPDGLRTFSSDKLANRGHVQVSINRIDSMEGGSRFLAEIADSLVKDLIRDKGPYKVMDVLAVLSKGNERPMHQDAFTGGNVFARGTFLKQNGDVAPRGCRILFDLGNIFQKKEDAPGPARHFEFERRQYRSRQDGEVLLSSTDEVILMDAAAAGAGQQGDIYHGRFGDGCTVSVDIVLPLAKSETVAAGGRLSSVLHKSSHTSPQHDTMAIRLCRRYFDVTGYFTRVGHAPYFAYGTGPGGMSGRGVSRLSADQRRDLTALSVRVAESWLSTEGGDVSDDGLWSDLLDSLLDHELRGDLTVECVRELVEGLQQHGAIDPLSEWHCHFCLTSYDSKSKHGVNGPVPRHASSSTEVRACGGCYSHYKRHVADFHATAAASSCTTVDCARCSMPEKRNKKPRVDSK